MDTLIAKVVRLPQPERMIPAPEPGPTHARLLGVLLIGFWDCVEPRDGRKSFDGLAGVVAAHLARDPLSGDLALLIRLAAK